jgi:hypothetical protein
MLLVIVDSFSKWPKVCVTKSTTAQSTINMLRSVFARWGIPEEVVSDNGTQFTSKEFEEFMAHLGIRHKRGAPYHPATNGLAERFVQTVKNGLKASQPEGLDIRYRLDRFLMAYRNAPHSTTGQSPAQLMLGRPLRTRFDCIKPSIISKQCDLSPTIRPREFSIGASVWVRCYMGATKWKQGVVLDQIGPLCYYVEVEGRKWKRHVDQLKGSERGMDHVLPAHLKTPPDIRELVSGNLGQLSCDIISRNHPQDAMVARQPVSSPQVGRSPPRVEPPRSANTQTQTVSTPGHPITSPVLRRSTRPRKAPERLQM